MNDDYIGIHTSIEKELDKRHLEIHIKIQKRNGKKSWTFIEGLDKLELPQNKSIDVFLEDVAKKLRKDLNCGANIEKPSNVIKLMGDHRANIKEFLIKSKIVNEDQIKMHGF